MKWKKINALKISDESTVYLWLSIGIIYTSIFWTYLNSLLCIILAGYWLIRSKKRIDISTSQTRLMILFVFLFFVFLIGMIYTSNTEEGWFRLQQKSAILFFPIIFGTTSVLNKELVNKISIHFVIATSVACFIGLCWGFIQYMESGKIEMLTNQHFTVFIDVYPYTMGLFCLLSIVILLYGLPINLKRKTSSLVLVGFLSIYIMTLSVRLIIACWFVIILIFTFKYIQAIRYRLLISVTLIVFICGAVAAIPSLKKQWQELTDFSKNNTIPLDENASLGKSWGGKSVRIAIWKCSEDLIRKHWLKGIGTGDIQDSLQQAYENRKFYFASKYNQYNSHNQYIQILIGQGVVGLLVFILCLIAPFFVLKRSVSNQIYFFFLSLFCIISFTEVILDTNKGIIWYSFFNSIFAFGQFTKPIYPPQNL